MSERILFVTVGGPHEPVDKAIRSAEADRVIFLSPKSWSRSVDGDGKPIEAESGARLASYVARHGLADRYQLVLLEDAEDLTTCYKQISQAMAALSDDQVCADYAGGSKTMAAALVLAALDYGVDLSLTSGPADLPGEEMTHEVSTASICFHRQLLREIPMALESHDYSAAVQMLEEAQRPRDLSRRTREKVGRLRTWTRGLDAWDRFQHREAYQILSPLRAYEAVRPYVLAADRIAACREAMENPEFKPNKSVNGYELVEDLLRNAERRAQARRYDDAVGRLYRALEMLCQVRLKRGYGIDTSNVPAQFLPAGWQAEAGPPPIRLGLSKGYELLAHLGDESVGKRYQSRHAQLLGSLQVRNYSLFAHGMRPVTQDDYTRYSEVVAGFIGAILDELRPSNQSLPQFPAKLPELD